MNFSKKNQELIKVNRKRVSKKIVAIAILLAFGTSLHAQWYKRVKGNGDMVTKTRSVGMIKYQ